MPQRDLSSEGVVAAWLSPGHVHHWFQESLLRTLEDGVWDGSRITVVSGPRIAEARSQIFDSFLRMPEKPEWIWLVDSDMSFPGESLRRLLATANRTSRQVVGGLCFAGGHSACVPTLYEAVELEDGTPAPRLVEDPKPLLNGQVHKVAATGGAFLLVHRNVIERMRRPHPMGFGTYGDGRHNPYPWFAEGVHIGGRVIGEDVLFTWRAHLLGFGVHVHTGVEIDHWKERPMNRQLYLSLAEQQQLAKVTVA